LQSVLAELLPPGTTPALGSLEELGLISCGVTDLPREVLKCLTRLRVLDLTGNKLVHLPDALTEVSSLELRASDADLLSALPKLSALRLWGPNVTSDVAHGSVMWAPACLKSFAEIARRLPELDLRFDLEAKDELDIDWSLWGE